MESLDKGFSAIGHILLDCVGKAPDSVLPLIRDLSSPAHVEALLMDRLIGELKSASSDRLIWRTGGGATWLAKAGRRMGIPTILAGSIGNDEAGRFLGRELLSAGIETMLFSSLKPTGRFCSLETPMGRRLIASPSAARDIRGAEIPDSFFKAGWVLHLDGLLIDSRPWLDSLAKRAHHVGMRISMDISTSSNAVIWGKELIEFSRSFCDIVFANEPEWEALMRNAVVETESAASPLWVVKKGSQGASVFDRGKWLHGATRNLGPVDDVGAGDFFAAGFLAAWIEGADCLECLKRGNAEASKTLSARRATHT